MAGKRNILVGISILALITCSAAAFADEPTITGCSLQECISTALINQVDVLVGKNNVTAAKARKTGALSGYYPAITIAATPISEVSRGTFGNNNDGSDTTQVSMSYNIYDGGAREASISQARDGITQNAAALKRTRQTVAYNVTTAYFNALRAQRLAEVADTQVKYLAGQRELVKARVVAGDAAEVDVLPVESQLANAKVTWLSAKNTIRTSLIQLQNAMGLEAQEGFAIQDVGEEPMEDLLTIEEYQAQALKARPDITQNKAAVSSARTGVRVARIETLPRLFSSASYGTPLFNNQNVFEGDSWTFAAGISYNLFDGKKAQSKVNEARATLATQQERAKQLQKDISAQLREAYINLENARERVAAAGLSLLAAQKNFEAQDARYKEGLGITLDLLNAQVNVATAQSNAVQARYDYLVAMAQLDYAVGAREV